MEQKSLYTDMASCLRDHNVISLRENVLEAEGHFVFSKDYCGFDGHFPGQPILPAIVQLAAVRFLAETVLETPLDPHEFSRVKFKGMVRPEEVVLVRIILERKDNRWAGSIKLENDVGQTLSSGQVVFSVGSGR